MLVGRRSSAIVARNSSRWIQKDERRRHPPDWCDWSKTRNRDWSNKSWRLCMVRTSTGVQKFASAKRFFSLFISVLPSSDYPMLSSTNLLPTDHARNQHTHRRVAAVCHGQPHTTWPYLLGVWWATSSFATSTKDRPTALHQTTRHTKSRRNVLARWYHILAPCWRSLSNIIDHYTLHYKIQSVTMRVLALLSLLSAVSAFTSPSFLGRSLPR
jgi:hypothetical protein